MHFALTGVSLTINLGGKIMKPREYNLQGIIITETNEIEGSNITWNQYISTDNLGLINFIGHGNIKYDILLLNAGKTEYDDNERFKNEEEINNYLENLPLWEKTKYFIKGIEKGIANLEYCDTIKIVEKRNAKKILKKLADTIMKIGHDYYNKNNK